jgi:hypothetical protein
MLQGTADVDAMAAAAPAVDAPAREPLHLGRCDLLQVAYELWADDRDDLFPPAVHPVNPPVATLSFLRAHESEHGAFTLAELRLLCRSGLRTRGLHVGAFVDSAAVAVVLARGWGYRVSVADVELSRRYDGTTGSVELDARPVVVTGHTAPVRLSPSDLQYTATMHPAMLERGLRLLQVERDHDFESAERGQPFLRDFDPAAWGDARVRPSSPVSASSAAADVTLRAIRFACRADVWAFEGTEPIAT